MKFACVCGGVIRDQTEFLDYKAHFISDQDVQDAEDAGDAVERLARFGYQCHECGRIYLVARSGELASFVPEQGDWKNIFSSVEGDEWKQLLEATWQEEFPDMTPGHLEHWGQILEFKSWPELEKAYYEIFERLKSQNRLRSAWLRKHGATLHDWDHEHGVRQVSDSQEPDIPQDSEAYEESAESPDKA